MARLPPGTMRAVRAGGVALCLWGAAAGPGAAHQAGDHAAAPEVEGVQEGAGAAAEPFPADIGGPFALVDQSGREMRDSDFRGRFMLVFFGYASCESICPVALKRMSEALEALGPAGQPVQPILITVDPERDTPEALAAAVPKIHPRLIGLTGTPEALAAARKAYKVNARPAGRSWKGTRLFSHGSYIYLMGPDGALLSVLPPVMSAESMAEVIRRYLP